jgi:hypothetical protein
MTAVVIPNAITCAAREQKRLRDEQAFIEAIEAELDRGGAGSMEDLIKRAQARVKRRRMQ